MKLSDLEVNPEALAALATEACNLLSLGNFSELAERFGYAIALGRSPSEAIRDDLAASLSQLGRQGIDPVAHPEIQVKYFSPNGASLFAVAECFLSTEGGSEVLMEVVVSSKGNEFHATLEQVSAAA